jgi:hypothetical protein
MEIRHKERGGEEEQQKLYFLLPVLFKRQLELLEILSSLFSLEVHRGVRSSTIRSARRSSLSSINDRETSCLWFEFPAWQTGTRFKCILLFTKLSTPHLVRRDVKITLYLCEHMIATGSWRSRDLYDRGTVSHVFRCSEVTCFRALQQSFQLYLIWVHE